MIYSKASLIFLASSVSSIFIGCDGQGVCTTIGIPAVRVTVICDNLPQQGDFSIMSKRDSDTTFRSCLTPNPLKCSESGTQVVVDCGPFRDPGKSLDDANYSVRLTQGDFIREVNMFVASDECHPDTVAVTLP